MAASGPADCWRHSQGYIAPISTQTDVKGIAAASTDKTRYFDQECLTKPILIEKSGNVGDTQIDALR